MKPHRLGLFESGTVATASVTPSVYPLTMPQTGLAVVHVGPLCKCLEVDQFVFVQGFERVEPEQRPVLRHPGGEGVELVPFALGRPGEIRSVREPG